MDFEKEEVSEEEIDDLGIKKKDNDEDDEGVVEEDADTDSDEEKENVDEGIFGDDKELEDYMLAGYDDRD